MKILTDKGKILTHNGKIIIFIDPFTPYVISNLQFWVDAADSSTIIKDSSDYISQWNDKSTNGWDLTQTIFDYRPQLIENVQNTNNAVRFDSINDYFRNTDMSILIQPITIYVVLKKNGTDINALFNNAEAGIHWSTYHGGMINAGVNLEVGGTFPTTTTIFKLVFDGETSSISHNNILVKTGNVSVNNFTPPFYLGSYLGGYFLDADIFEFIIYSSIPTIKENTQMTNYLSTKWGVTI